MSAASSIEWTHHTFNPWWGCSRVSPGCRLCYAEHTARRYGHHVWNRQGPRRLLSDDNWRTPLKWNRDAERAGRPALVFCASMADVFEDHPDVTEPRQRLWDLIEATPWLHWQLLTKRPEHVAGMVPWGNSWPEHVWLGTSVENQQVAAVRIPRLLGIPAKIRFLSCEPLLGPVDPGFAICQQTASERGHGLTASTVHLDGCCQRALERSGLDWVIVGGESGPGARPMDPAWARQLVTQCRAAEISVFVKQMGSVVGKLVGAGSKGGDWTAWPEDLRVREFPEAAA